jgi:hypothetical protein
LARAMVACFVVYALSPLCSAVSGVSDSPVIQASAEFSYSGIRILFVERFFWNLLRCTDLDDMAGSGGVLIKKAKTIVASRDPARGLQLDIYSLAGGSGFPPPHSVSAFLHIDEIPRWVRTTLHSCSGLSPPTV